MLRLIRNLIFLSLVAGLLTACNQGDNLAGDWTLKISDYKNSCGGEPTVSKTINLVQSGKALTATIDVTGDDGKIYQGTFKGTMDKPKPPAKVTLHGKFPVGKYITEEAIQVKFLDYKTFTGSSKWNTNSIDNKTNCVGTQNVNGSKE